MKRRQLISVGLMIAVLLCTASVTQGAGQNARLGALGVDGDLLEDPVNVGIYPSNMLFWTNLVTADIGRGDIAHHSLWGSWEIKGLGALGLGLIGEQANFGPPPHGVRGGGLFSLYWGSAFGRDAGIGVVLEHSADGEENSADRTSQNGIDVLDDEERGSVIGTRAGFHKPIGLFRRVDASIGYRRGTSESLRKHIPPNLGSASRLRESEAKNSTLDLNLRALSGSGSVTFIPSLHVSFLHGEAEMSDLGGTDLDSGNGSEEDRDSWAYQGQLGVQAKARKHAMVYAAVGVRHESSKTERGTFRIDDGWVDATSYSENKTEHRSTQLPYAAVGAEAEVTKWLTLRFGATKSQRTDRTETTLHQDRDRPRFIRRTTTETTVSPLDVFYGFGIEAGSFAFDAVLDNDFLYEWGYIVSGERQRPVTEVSVTYTFD